MKVPPNILEESVGDALFAVVDQLNRVQHGPTRGLLTQAQADEIRVRVEVGETQKAVAAAWGSPEGSAARSSRATSGNPAKYRVGTKGTEMRRRLIGAFDGGMRRSEMMLTQIKQVTWTPLTITVDGQPITAYRSCCRPRYQGGEDLGPEREHLCRDAALSRDARTAAVPAAPPECGGQDGAEPRSVR